MEYFCNIRSSKAIALTLGLLTIVLNTTLAQDNFYFSIQPKNLNVIHGQSATLECNVSNNKHIMFYWTLKGEQFPNTTRRFQMGSNLHITRVNKEQDLGEFKCIAMNVSTGFSLSSSGVTLNIMWIGEKASVVLQSPEFNEQIEEGIELTLRCKIEGNPEVEYEWYRNSIRIFADTRTAIRGKRLHITNISAKDNGIYSCRAINEAGTVDSTDNFALVLSHPLAAKIIKLPQDMTVKKNEPARFDCIFEDAVVTEWFSRDVPLKNDTRFTIYPNGSLYFHRVKVSDEGFYKCVGIKDVSKGEPIPQIFTAELAIANLGDITEDSFEPKQNPNEKIIIPENGEFEITCKRPNGHPSPRVWWQDPYGKIISDTGRIRVDDTRLILTNAKKGDSGNYTCVAENMAGIKSNFIQLAVSVSPRITSHPVSIGLNEGESAQFVCEYVGSPFPVTVVNWLKDNKYVREDAYHRVHFHNATLQINSVHLSDNGTYVCEINTTGFQPVLSESSHLIVKEKLKFFPVPVNKKLELGAQAKIYCKARGATKPVVRWNKEGQPFFEWPAHIRDENGTLFFNTVKSEDAGRYTCIATSSQGLINVTITVEVIVTPKFTVKPTNTEAYEGYPIMIDCKAFGDPQPTIQWDKNSMLNGFDPKRFRVMENGSMLITEVHMDDQGRYGCTAGNSGGFKREEVSLLVKSAENYNPNKRSNDADDDQKDDNMMTKTVTITLGAAAAYMILVVGLMIWCRYRRTKRMAAYLQQSAAEVNKTENGDIPHNAEMKERPVREYKDNVKSDGEGHSHASSQSHHSRRSRTSYDRLQFPRHDLQTVMLLGKGEFGEVFLAKARGISEGNNETIVMVKALQSRDEGIQFNFKREMDTYNKLNHVNIARLLGICREAEPHFMIMEYSDWGDLKQFLLATRKDNPRKSPRPPRLITSQIIIMCNQIVQGMEYFSHQRLVHRDLAARNCLVSSSLDIKISNPSLSRDTYAREYYRYRNQMIPLRWMPYEAIFDDEYSVKSDAWSFAVLVLELLTQAEFPFAEKSDDEYLQLMKSHEMTWEVPEQCPDTLKQLLVQCWSQNPKDRPTFSELALQIGGINIDSNV